MRRTARHTALFALATVLACTADPRDEPAGRGVANDAPGPTADSLAAAPAGWPVDYGPLLVVPSPTGDGASLVAPLAPSVATASAVLPPTDGLDVMLVDRGGNRGIGILGSALPPTSACPAWPVVTMAAEIPWRVGLPRGVATSIPLRGAELLPTADSLRLSITVARLASRAVGAADPAFADLPFVMRGAWEGWLPDSAAVLVAIVARTVAIEDRPSSEQLTFIAERPLGASGDPVLRWVDRRVGPEADVDIDEVLAMLRFTATGRPGLLLERADGRGPLLLLVQRDAAGAWHTRWQGPRAGCPGDAP
jgi:hypothetical protein